jgi:tetratricopeptide (TPR) repeat protein
MRERGDATGDVPMQVLGYDAGANICYWLGEFTTGRAYVEQSLALYDPAHRPFYSELLSLDMLVFLRLHSSYLLACLGHLDQALFQRGAAVEDARRLNHPPSLAIALVAAGVSGWCIRLEPGTLLEYADEVLALATEHGLELYWALARIERGWCLAALGRADQGIPLVIAGAAGSQELGFIVFRPWVLTLLGDAYRMAGQGQDALEHVAEARRLAEEREERWCQAETVRLTGDVVVAMGDHAGAEASYREAIAIAQQQNAKLWELRAATSLARLWRDQGKSAQARELLAPVYGWFTEGFGTLVLQEAKALLEELAA